MNKRVYISTPGWLDTKIVKLMNLRSGAGEEDMLRYVQDLRAVRRMEFKASQIIILYTVNLGWWVHGLREVVNEARRIKSEKLKEQYIDGYARFLESKRVE